MRKFVSRHKQAIATLPLIVFDLCYGAWHMPGISSLLLIIGIVLIVSVEMQYGAFIHRLKPVNYGLVTLNIGLILGWLTWATMDSLSIVPVVLALFVLALFGAYHVLMGEWGLRNSSNSK